MIDSPLLSPVQPSVDDTPGLEKRLLGVIQALPDAILCVNRDWTISYANKEALRIARMTSSQLQDATLWELFPDLLGTPVEQQYRDAMAKAQAGSAELYYQPFDVWVDIRILPTGEGLTLFYRDITQQKLAQAREAEAQQRIHRAFEATPDGIVIIDQHWRFAFANPRALELVGESDIVGHDIFELFPGNTEEPFYSSYRTTMFTRQPTDFEAFHSAPLNIWLKVLAKPYEDGIIVFFSDITQRKEAELREQETARQLAQVLDVTSDGVASIDREWRFTYLNPTAQKMIDPANRLIGASLWEEFPAIVNGPVWDMYHASMNRGITGTTELYYPEPMNAWFSVQSRPAPHGIVLFFRNITEQKLRESALREQQELLHAVQQVARLATWELNFDSGQILYGPGSYDVLGRPLEELNTLDSLTRHLLPGHLEVVRASIDRAVQIGEPVMIEFALKAADGSVLWIESRGQAVPGPGPVRLRGMSIDITQRKLFEQDLVASESRYRVLADLNPQAIWMGDSAGNITYGNQGFLAYIGLSAEKLSGRAWLEAFAPEDRDRVVEAWTHSVKTGVDYDIEARLRDIGTGTYRWWNLRAAPVRDASGSILHWLGVGIDIDDARTYAETLRAEQVETERRRAELETIYKTTPVGLALLDPVDFTFLNLNDHEAEMLGFPKDYILGRPLSEIAPPQSIPDLVGMLRSVAAGASIRDRLLEGSLASRPGEVRAWSVNYSPIYNEDGTIRAISTASIEITNQKKAEAALIQSEKLAAVGRLASSISHEINNPLEAITNLLYLISVDSSLNPEMRSYVQMAQSELSRVSQIATQTLRFHRQAVAPTLVTAAELVGAVVRLYTGRLANSNIRVDARYNTDAKICCFENDIRQVLNNLIANAIDAMRKGGRLAIRAHDATGYAPGRPPRKGVRITIADSGHGMSPSVLARVFEPFFTTKDLNGTGLGLWISTGIVDRHHGRLRVRSTEHPVYHGTVFTLFLPCEEGR